MAIHNLDLQQALLRSQQQHAGDIAQLTHQIETSKERAGLMEASLQQAVTTLQVLNAQSLLLCVCH